MWACCSHHTTTTALDWVKWSASVSWSSGMRARKWCQVPGVTRHASWLQLRLPPRQSYADSIYRTRRLILYRNSKGWGKSYFSHLYKAITGHTDRLTEIHYKSLPDVWPLSNLYLNKIFWFRTCRIVIKTKLFPAVFKTTPVKDDKLLSWQWNSPQFL